MATLLGISESYAAALIAMGEIPSFRIGTRRLVSMDLLREWVVAAARDGRAIEVPSRLRQARGELPVASQPPQKTSAARRRLAHQREAGEQE